MTYTVTTASPTISNPNGEVSLSDAMLKMSNDFAANPGDSYLINFAIPGSGVQTLDLSQYYDHTLPPTNTPVAGNNITINGYSQSGASANDLAVGDDAVILIQLDDSFQFTGSHVTIEGMSLPQIVNVSASTANDTFQGNFIGVKADGETSWETNGSEVGLGVADNNTIGGTTPAARNVIADDAGSNNNLVGGDGIEIDGSGNTIEGNYIGTDKSGTSAIGNGGAGLAIYANSGDPVPTDNVIENNVIAFNDSNLTEDYPEAGVVVQEGTGTQILGNSIFANSNGIDLIGGANNNQAAPTLTTVTASAVTGVVPGAVAGAMYTIQLFTNTGPDPKGHIEGQTLLSSSTVPLGTGGTFSISVSAMPSGTVSATATDANGNTSEFGVLVAIPTHTWSGAGKTPAWSNPANWVEGTVPGANEHLIFPAGAARLKSVNDVANLTVYDIEIDASYTLSGLAIQVVNGYNITAGDPKIKFGVTLENDTGPAAATAGPTAVTDMPFAVAQGAIASMNDPICGPGGLIKTGPGTLVINNPRGPNTFSGSIQLQNGFLEIDSKGGLGTGTLEVQVASQNTAYLALGGKASELSNAVSLQGGTLDLDSTMQLSGGITVTADSVLVVANTHSKIFVTVQGSAGISGPGMLTVQGPDELELNCPLSSDLTVGAGNAQVEAGAVVLGPQFSGLTGSITVNGGTLTSKVANNPFKGDIELQAGVLEISGIDALGQGDLLVNTGSDLAAIEPKGKYASLGNTVKLQGGKLAVLKGNLYLGGQVIVNPATEIDPAKGALVTCTTAGSVVDNASGSVLTVGGTGDVLLAGFLTAAVTVTGEVSLGTGFTGSGALTVSGGGELISTNDISAYTGTVQLQGGTALLDGNNPLGTGELDLGGAGPGVSLQARDVGITLGNANVVLQGGTVALSTLSSLGILLLKIDSPVNVKNATTLSPAAGNGAKFVVTLAGAVTGSAALTLQLSCDMSGTLDAPLMVTNGGTAQLDATLKGNGPITVNGGTLASFASVSGFTGAITVQAGEITVQAENALGMGTLSLGGAGATVSIFASHTFSPLGNSAVTFNGGTLAVSAGIVGITGPVTLAQDTSIDLSKKGALFLGNVSGAHALAVEGASEKHDVLALEGTLDATQVTAGEGSTVEEVLPGFSAIDGATVLATGGQVKTVTAS